MPSKFTQFFKREFGPYFRDFSDYDFRFFRTFRDSFLRPTKVIEANDGTYTGELKFVFNVFTLLFIAYFLQNPSWIDSIEPHSLWKYTLPHQQYLQLNKSIEENYYGYLMAVSFIPLYFLILKLLFYRKKPWGFFLSAAFYLTSVVFTLLLSTTFVLNALEIESEIVIIPVLGVVTIYPIVALKIQHWFWSTVKAIIATTIPLIVGPPLFEDTLFNLITNLSTDQEAVAMTSQEEWIVSTQVLPNESEGIQQIVMNSDENFVVLGYEKLLWYEKGTVIREVPLTDYHEKKIKKLPNDDYLVACFHPSKEVVLTLFSSTGDTLSNGRVQHSGEKSLTIRMPQREYATAFVGDLAVGLSREAGDWKMEAASTISNPGTTVSYQNLGFGSALRETIKRGPKHVQQLEVSFLDSADRVVWKQSLYEKNGPYDPLDLLMTYIDTAESTVFTHYTLANDSTYHSFISAFDLTTGGIQWENYFSIPADVTEYEGIIADRDFLYLYGEGHKFYSEWFWQPTYHIGLVVKVDRKTGNYVSHLFLGPDEDWAAHSHVYGLYPTESELSLLSFDNSEEPLPWEDTDALYLKRIRKEF